MDFIKYRVQRDPRGISKWAITSQVVYDGGHIGPVTFVEGFKSKTEANLRLKDYQKENENG